MKSVFFLLIVLLRCDTRLVVFVSAHLYFMLPYKSEGGLAIYRSALVQNKHLAQLAQVNIGKHYVQKPCLKKKC